MQPFLVYKLYLALKLHFTTDKYDVIKMKGRVRASEEAFVRRNDLVGIRRLARKYDVAQVTNFLVASFITGDKGGGMFSLTSESVYKDWLTRMESLSYLYQNELRTLFEDAPSVESIFSCKSGHPPILKAYLNGSVSLETLVILNRALPFVDQVSTYLSNDIIWPDIRRLIVKYTPFVRINKHKYKTLTDKVIATHFTGE